MVVVEVPPPSRLLAVTDRFWQARVLQHEEVRNLLRRSDEDFRLLFTRTAGLKKLVTPFDRGWMAATVYSRADPPRRWHCLAAAASSSAATRGQEEELTRFLLGGDDKHERQGGKLVFDDMPLQDTPVLVRTFRIRKDDTVEAGRVSRVLDPLLCYARNRGLVASCSAWFENGRPGPQDLLAELVGLGRRHGPEIAQQDNRLLASMTFYPRVAATLGSGRAASVMERLVLEDLARIHAEILLADDPARLVEHIDLHEDRKIPSFLRVFAQAPEPLAAVARHLPAETLAAVHFGVDPAEVAACARYRTKQQGRPEAAQLWLRSLQGVLGRSAAGASVTDLHQATLFWLPPEVGGPFGPQPCMLVRANGQDAVERVLAGVARVFASRASRPGVPEEGYPSCDYMRRVRYVRLKDYFVVNDLWVPNILFGGLVSATRVGPYVAIGCNPKALMHLHAALERGETLAKRKSFASHFATRGAHNVIEAFADFPGMVRHRTDLERWWWSSVASALPGIVAAVRVGPSNGEAIVESVLTGNDGKGVDPVDRMLQEVTEERFWMDATDFGHRIRHEGGTLLSPVAWALAFYAVHSIGVVTALGK